MTVRTLCLIAVAVLLPAAPALAQWVDVPLTNPGFEEWADGAPVGWETPQYLGDDACAHPGVLADTTDATEGARALLLRGDAATCAWSAALLPALPAEPGEVYRLSVDLRAIGVDPTGQRSQNRQAFVLVQNAEGRRLALYRTPLLDGTTDWERHEFALQVPPGAVRLQPGVFLSVPGALLADAMRLEKLVPPAVAADADRATRWRADADHLLTLLETFHPDPWAVTDKATFTAGLDAVVAAAADPAVADETLIWRLRAVVGSLGDSHTDSGAPADVLQSLPLLAEWFDDGVRVIAATAEDSVLVGGRITAVDGRPVAAVLDGLGPQIVRTHPVRFRTQAPGWLIAPRALRQLGLADGPDALTFTVVLDDGREVTHRVTRHDPRGADIVWAGPAEDARPLYRRDDRFYWFTYLPESRTLYLKYDRARDDPERPLKTFGREVFAALDANPVDRFVMDLRANSGGSNLLNGLYNHLAELLQKGALKRTFVLTGGRTYSAAVYDADAMRQRCGAVVVGEPTGMAPMHPGQVATFTLPGTGREFACSTRIIQASPDPSPALMPDVKAPVTWADFLAGRDPALAEVEAYPVK